jgi:hypothetical protein
MATCVAHRYTNFSRPIFVSGAGKRASAGQQQAHSSAAAHGSMRLTRPFRESLAWHKASVNDLLNLN